MEPRELAQRAERLAPSSGPNQERFAGYGIMGLTFASGHVLALRRFTSSIGPAYTSLWHRDPGGRWTFYANVEPLESCNRYFGSAVERFVPAEIVINWTGPRSLTVGVPTVAFHWEAELTPTAATRLMNAIGRLMPEPLWHSGAVLDVMAAVAGPLLKAGRLRMHGRAPNGQSFVANPRLIWMIDSSSASVAGEELGPPGPLAEQAWLGDFAIPQRGLFAIGKGLFEPFDASRHLAVAART